MEPKRTMRLHPEIKNKVTNIQKEKGICPRRWFPLAFDYLIKTWGSHCARDIKKCTA